METLKRVDEIHIKKSGVNKLRSKTLKAYRKLGETDNSIRVINDLAGQYFQDLKESRYYLTQHKNIVRQAVVSGEYQRISLVDEGSIKLSMHVMPKGSQIQMHAHPDMFSVTLVDQGELKIRYDSWGRLHPLKVSDPSLKFTLFRANQVSSGLPVKNNLHQIQAVSNVSVFFSLRIKALSGHHLLEQLFFKKKLVASGFFMGVLMPFISLIGATSSAAFCGNERIKDYSEMVLSSEKEQIHIEKALQNHREAKKLRQSNHYDNQVEAFTYYSKEALRGDAYSQYWLGVMYLEGRGITEDGTMALEWVSKAAKQNYPPAEKLLAHLLATDFDMEC